MHPHPTLRSTLALVASLLVLPLTNSFAQFTWNGGGGDNNFTTGANWGGTAPSATATTNVLIFDGSTRLTPNVDTSSFDFQTLRFASTASSFNISGSSLEVNGGSAIIEQLSANNQTVSSIIELKNNSPTIQGAGAGLLTLAEVRNFTSGRGLNINRHATVTSFTADGTAPIANLTINSASTLTLGSMTSGSGGYGALSANNASARLNTTTSGSYGFSSIFTDSFTFGGAANVTWAVGSSGWTFNGNAAKTITLTDAGTKQFNSALFLNNNNSNIRQITFDVSGGEAKLNGQIKNQNGADGSGSGGLIKSGTGVLALSNASANSDFTGAVSITTGTLVVEANNSLGTTAGSTTVSSGASLGFRGGVNYSTTEGVSAAGTGATGSGAIKNVSGNNSFAGGISLTAATSLGADAGSLTLSGAVTGSQAITKVGTGTVVLANAANAFSGVTISNGTLESQAAGAIGSSLTSIAGSGTVLFSTANQGAGYTSTTFGANTASVNVASGITAILTNASGAHSAIGFTKKGAGTLELTGAHGFNNATTVTISEGTVVGNRSGNPVITGTTPLVIGDGVNTAMFQNKTGTANFQIISTAPVTINTNGTLDLNGVSGTLNSVTMNGGAITTGAGTLTFGGTATAFTYGGNTTASLAGSYNLSTAGTRTFTVANGTATNDVSISGTITGAGTLEKAGAGLMRLSGSNNFTGSTIVTSGTLELATTGGGGAALGTAAVSVVSGATLLISASDQVNNVATVSLSGGTIQRGSGVAETFGNLSLAASSFIDFGSGTASSLNFGTYTGGGFKLNVNNFLVGNVLTFKTDLTTTINNTSLFGFDNGFTSAWNSGTSTFTITAIPEPSSVLAALGLGGLLLWPAARRLRGQLRRR